MAKTALIIAFLAITFFIGAEALRKQSYVNVKANPKGNFVPIARFWYDSHPPPPPNETRGDEPPLLQWVITKFNPDSVGTQVLIYDDQATEWGGVTKKGLTCQEKVAMHVNNGNVTLTQNGQTGFNTISERSKRHWYIVLANCEGPIDIDYEINMLNPGGKHTTEFSLDQQGFWGLYLSFFLFYFFFLPAVGYVVFSLFRTGSFSLIVKLYTLSVFMQFVSLMFGLIHYDIYWRNGEGSPGSLFFGQIMSFVGHWLLIGMFILIARGVLSANNGLLTEKRNMIIILGGLMLLDICWFIWRSTVYHSVTSPPFIFGSAPSILMLIIRVFVLVYFVVIVRYSLLTESDPEKKSFYFRFAITAGIWLAVLPFLVMIVAAIDARTRPYAMNLGVEAPWMLVNFIVQVFFLVYYFWPSRISANFDFAKSDVLVGGSSPYETL